MLLVPLVLYLVVELRTQLVVDLLVHENSLEERLYHVYEVNLLLCILVHLDFEVFQELQSVDFLDDEATLLIYQVAVLLPHTFRSIFFVSIGHCVFKNRR